jgi:O-methyltransferase involved in polyketide biosynthesis
MESLCTAYLTLLARAREHRRTDSIFRDQVASEWELHLSQLDASLWGNRVAQECFGDLFCDGIVLRTVLFDYATLGFLAQHSGGLVFELGCGFSTRVYRLNPGRVTAWFHVDLPEVMDVRDQLEHPFPAIPEVNIGGDLTEQNWLSFSRLSGDVLVILEGVISYLALGHAQSLLRFLKTSFPGSTVLATVPTELFGEHQWCATSSAELEEKIHCPIMRTWNMNIVARRLALAQIAEVPEVPGYLFEALL